MPQSQRLRSLSYVIGAASFIPAIDVLFGLIAIIVGIAQRARMIIVLGVSGILFSVFLYAALFSSGGVYARLDSGLAVYVLHEAVKEIEAYKLQHGRYPASLDEIEPKDKKRIDSFIDPMAHGGGTLNGRFYYQFDPSGEFYYLRSVGRDGNAGCEDPQHRPSSSGARPAAPDGTEGTPAGRDSIAGRADKRCFTGSPDRSPLDRDVVRIGLVVVAPAELVRSRLRRLVSER